MKALLDLLETNILSAAALSLNEETQVTEKNSGTFKFRQGSPLADS